MLKLWDWTDLCVTGLEPFTNNSNVLLPCYQEIVFQMPLFTVFAASSAFHFGSMTHYVSRNRIQLLSINFRVFFAILLGLLPILKIFNFFHMGVEIYAADILVACSETIMWIVHCAYLISLKHSGGLSHRGSLVIIANWLAIFILDTLWFFSTTQFVWWPWSLFTLLLDICYCMTLIPKGYAVIVPTDYFSSISENSPLLRSQRYTEFQLNAHEAHLGHAQDEATNSSRFFFQWVGPLIAKGFAGNLKNIEDLFDLPESLNVYRINDRLQLCISTRKKLFWALHEVFGREFYIIGVLKFITDIANFLGPLLLGGLLSQSYSKEKINENNSENMFQWKPYIYALGLLTTQLLYAICSSHFQWRMTMVGMKMRIGVVSAIYKKSLESHGLKHSPEILNLMSTDTDRIVNSCISFHSFWSIPLQLFVTLYLLYIQLGPAFIAGVLFVLALIPFNRWLAKRISYYSKSLMSAKDSRLAATNETIVGAKQIKLLAWENIFIKKISNLREKEIEFLSKRKYLDALCVYFWATTPVLMCFLTLGVSVSLGHRLTAASTYTSVALLNLLIAPLNAFPWVMNGLVEAWISIKRVQKLLDISNFQIDGYYQEIVSSHQTTEKLDASTVILRIQNATFKYETNCIDEDTFLSPSSSNNSFLLECINLEIKEGELICIDGAVGSGKSTLISALVGEVSCLKGSMHQQYSATGFGYVPQTPWLQRGTIRENILWGSLFEKQWYKSVLYACALVEDITELGGDLIGIGENGYTLSGGQRARIALARAVYQNKQIYLLDDILSALDAHVARHIIKHCVLGLLKNKTRIIITHHITLFYYANQILHLDQGKLTTSKYMSGSIDLSLDDIEENREEHTIQRKGSINLEGSYMSESSHSVDSLIMDESRKYGFLAWDVIACYWNAISSPLAFTILLFVILMQFTRNLSDAWLAHWVTYATLVNCSQHDSFVIWPINGHEETLEIAHTTGYYLGIYSILALVNSLITLARSFLFAYGGLKAAKFIHDKLLLSVIYTKFNFFDTTSVGRMLNRFSSDIYTVDDTLPFILNILLAQVVSLVGTVGISLYAMPWLSLIIVPLIPIYIHLQHRYRFASRDIKRLSCNALSPLYIHFTETLQGLTTIRSMRASKRFQRDFLVKLEESIKAQLTAGAAQSWLSLRLQFLGAILVGGAGLLAAMTSAHITQPGLVGLAISYALSVTAVLSGVLNAVAETEQELIAIERIDEYLRLDSEETSDGCTQVPFGWPTQGVINFSDVQLRYREHLTPALRDISFQTDAFEHLAIVGRTGSGKSSILSALMRVVTLSRGEIFLDCLNILTVSLHILRERIDIIPQDPFLFEGTVRENLDPHCNYYDTEIWHAVTNNSAATCMIQSLGGLDGKIEKGGANLSAGQKQLLCLIRSLLKNSKVICIDEGTSNLDSDADQAVHQALRTSFKCSTVIFIAHKLNSLQHMDRIIVLDEGLIREQGNPIDLAKNKTSIFHSMLQAQHINIDEFCCKKI